MLAAAGLLYSQTSAGALTRQQIAWCENRLDDFSPELQIKGCTAVIQSGQRSGRKLAEAYERRASAYLAPQKEDYDRAIADLTMAIKLGGRDPQFVVNNLMTRASAHLGKRDYDGAIADHRRALDIVEREPAARSDSILGVSTALLFSIGGSAHRAKGDPDGAIAAYTRDIRLVRKYVSDTSVQTRRLVDSLTERADVYLRDKRDYDRAIADYSEAIQLLANSGDDDDRQRRADILDDRAWAYGSKGDYDRAIADYTRAIQLDPKEALLHANRGEAYARRGDDARAAADFAEAMRLDPKSDTPYFYRGRLRFKSGQFAMAASDFARAVDLDQDSSVNALWLHIAQARAGNPKARDGLAENTRAWKRNEWPYPAVGLFLARTAPGRVLALAKGSGERCEANFYIGEWHLIRDEREAARKYFQQAADGCPKVLAAYDGAVGELKRLGPAARREPPQAPPPGAAVGKAAPTGGDACAGVEAHWKGAEALGILAGYEDHLARFPNCAFATLAKIKITALRKAQPGPREDAAGPVAERDPEPQSSGQPGAGPSGTSSSVSKAAAEHVRRGRAHIDRREYDRAIAEYTEAIRLDPRSGLAFWGRGVAYRGKRDFDRAIADFDKAIQLSPDQAVPLFSRGVAYRLKGDYDRAIADLSEAIRLKPDNPAPFYGRAVAYRLKRDYDRAVADFDEAIRLDPDKPELRHGRGLAYRLNRDYDRAIADFDAAIRLERGARKAIPLHSRGIAYHYKRDHERAIADFSESIRLDPTYALAFYDRGMEFFLRGDYDRAIDDFSETIRLDPKNARAFNNRGHAHYRKQAYRRAIDDYSAALRREPKLASALYGRGLAAIRTGDVAAGKADIGSAQRLEPGVAKRLAGIGIAPVQ